MSLPTFYVGDEIATVDPIDMPRAVDSSPGWNRQRFKVTGGLVLWITTHKTGLTYYDLYHAGEIEQPIPVTVQGGVRFDVDPGAAVGFSVMPGMTIPPYRVEVPVGHGEKLADGSWFPDQVDTSLPGSKRNGMSSTAWRVLKDRKGWLSEHFNALRFLEVQLMRNYQNADANGEFADHRRKIPWPPRIINVYSPKYGSVPQRMLGYDGHHIAGQELAGIYELSRDPRAYDQLKRLTLHVGRWGVPSWYGKGHTDNGRVKGWPMALFARALHAARKAGDQVFESEVSTFINRGLLDIKSLMGSEGRVTPNRVEPDGRHIKGEWSDSVWQCAILAHGLDLAYRATGRTDAAHLRNQVLDAIENLFWDGETLFNDICADGTKREKWKPLTKADGTTKYVAEVLIQCGRHDSPVLAWIQSWRLANKKEPVTWSDYFSEGE